MKSKYKVTHSHGHPLIYHIDGFVQDCSNSSVSAMELLQSCANPSTWLLSVPGSIKIHEDIIKWKHFPHNWPFVSAIHQSPVNSPHKGPVMQSFDVFFILAWTICWTNIWVASDIRCHEASVMTPKWIAIVSQIIVTELIWNAEYLSTSTTIS